MLAWARESRPASGGSNAPPHGRLSAAASATTSSKVTFVHPTTTTSGTTPIRVSAFRQLLRSSGTNALSAFSWNGADEQQQLQPHNGAVAERWINGDINARDTVATVELRSLFASGVDDPSAATLDIAVQPTDDRGANFPSSCVISVLTSDIADPTLAQQDVVVKQWKLSITSRESLRTQLSVKTLVNIAQVLHAKSDDGSSNGRHASERRMFLTFRFLGCSDLSCMHRIRSVQLEYVFLPSTSSSAGGGGGGGAAAGTTAAASSGVLSSWMEQVVMSPPQATPSTTTGAARRGAGAITALNDSVDLEIRMDLSPQPAAQGAHDESSRVSISPREPSHLRAPNFGEDIDEQQQQHHRPLFAHPGEMHTQSQHHHVSSRSSNTTGSGAMHDVTNGQRPGGTKKAGPHHSQQQKQHQQATTTTTAAPPVPLQPWPTTGGRGAGATKGGRERMKVREIDASDPEAKVIEIYASPNTTERQQHPPVTTPRQLLGTAGVTVLAISPLGGGATPGAALPLPTDAWNDAVVLTGTPPSPEQRRKYSNRADATEVAEDDGDCDIVVLSEAPVHDDFLESAGGGGGGGICSYALSPPPPAPRAAPTPQKAFTLHHAPPQSVPHNVAATGTTQLAPTQQQQQQQQQQQLPPLVQHARRSISLDDSDDDVSPPARHPPPVPTPSLDFDGSVSVATFAQPSRTVHAAGAAVTVPPLGMTVLDLVRTTLEADKATAALPASPATLLPPPLQPPSTSAAATAIPLAPHHAEVWHHTATASVMSNTGICDKTTSGGSSTLATATRGLRIPPVDSFVSVKSVRAHHRDARPSNSADADDDDGGIPLSCFPARIAPVLSAKQIDDARAALQSLDDVPQYRAEDDLFARVGDVLGVESASISRAPSTSRRSSRSSSVESSSLHRRSQSSSSTAAPVGGSKMNGALRMTAVVSTASTTASASSTAMPVSGGNPPAKSAAAATPSTTDATRDAPRFSLPHLQDTISEFLSSGSALIRLKMGSSNPNTPRYSPYDEELKAPAPPAHPQPIVVAASAAGTTASRADADNTAGAALVPQEALAASGPFKRPTSMLVSVPSSSGAPVGLNSSQDRFFDSRFSTAAASSASSTRSMTPTSLGAAFLHRSASPSITMQAVAAATTTLPPPPRTAAPAAALCHPPTGGIADSVASLSHDVVLWCNKHHTTRNGVGRRLIALRPSTSTADGIVFSMRRPDGSTWKGPADPTVSPQPIQTDGGMEADGGPSNSVLLDRAGFVRVLVGVEAYNSPHIHRNRVHRACNCVVVLRKERVITALEFDSESECASFVGALAPVLRAN